MVKAIVTFLVILSIVLFMWSQSNAMSATTEMTVIANDGKRIKVEDTDGNYYVFFFDKGSKLQVGSTVVVEIIMEFKPGDVESFRVITMYILETANE